MTSISIPFCFKFLACLTASFALSLSNHKKTLLKRCNRVSVSSKDIIIVNQSSGPLNYQTCVSNVAPGQFAITITNVLGGGGNSSDTLGLNFAIIRVQ